LGLDLSVSLTVNGSTFVYPTDNDTDWGAQASAWASAVTQGMLQRAGGSFPLAADVDFGASYGLKSAYYKSRSASAASTGIVRLANLEGVSWRNAANGADLALTADGADQLLFNGAPVGGAGAVTFAAVGSTPNANAASISTGVITMQPASGSFPGVVTAAAQTLGGTKTFAVPPLLPDGTAAAPAIAFGADTNTGIYRPASDNLTVALAGAAAATFSANGLTFAGPTTAITTTNLYLDAALRLKIRVDGGSAVSIAATDIIVMCSLIGAVTVTLPAAASHPGRVLAIVDTAGVDRGLDPITVATVSPANYDISTNNGAVVVFSNGTAWRVLANAT
jgi:hypothetical protein